MAGTASRLRHVDMTVVVVVFSEMLPKTAAFNARDRTALMVARPMSFFIKVLGPALMAIEALVRWLLCRRHARRQGPVSPFGARRIARRGRSAPPRRRRGSVDREMSGGVLDLRELALSDVMIHRTNMITLNADDSPEDVVNAVIASPVTRIPLWREIRRILSGVLHVKDLLCDCMLSTATLPRSTLPR